MRVKLTEFLPGDSRKKEGDAIVGMNCVIESFVVRSEIELHPVTVNCLCGSRDSVGDSMGAILAALPRRL